MHSRAKREVMSKMTKKKAGNWIKDAIKIPKEKLEKATCSKSRLTRKRANLAETLKGFRH